MRSHVVAGRQSEDVQIVMEIKLALSYLLFLILCKSLIGWVWLCGPIRTRKIVRRTLQWLASQRAAFDQLMAAVDPPNHKTLETPCHQETPQTCTLLEHNLRTEKP